MSDKEEHLVPTDISLHQKSRLLAIRFSDGAEFKLPYEYLRVLSPAREVKAGAPETNKQSVNIESIEPQGNYAVRILFDDGHDTGIYSWEWLYELGKNQEQNWQAYLAKLEAAGLKREAGTETNDQRKIKILYFSYLVSMLGRESEEYLIPPHVADVQSLLEWLRKIKLDRGYLLASDRVRCTLNRQFAEPFSKLDSGDEVGIIPNSPTPPSPPSGKR